MVDGRESGSSERDPSPVIFQPGREDPGGTMGTLMGRALISIHPSGNSATLHPL